jgi:hypothetical protein
MFDQLGKAFRRTHAMRPAVGGKKLANRFRLNRLYAANLHRGCLYQCQAAFLAITRSIAANGLGSIHADTSKSAFKNPRWNRKSL